MSITLSSLLSALTPGRHQPSDETDFVLLAGHAYLLTRRLLVVSSVDKLQLPSHSTLGWTSLSLLGKTEKTILWTGREHRLGRLEAKKEFRVLRAAVPWCSGEGGEPAPAP